MNKSTSIFTVCLYVLFLGLAGCAKDSGNGPDEDLNDEQLETKILGKWEISNFPTELFPTADAGLRPQASISKNMLLAGRAGVVAEVGGVGTITAFIEFLPDDTYLVQDAAGNAFSGGYVVKSGQTITLTGIGSISDIVFSGSRLDFKLSLSISGTTQVLEITANKKPPIADNDRTDLLAQTWSLYSEEDHEGNIAFLDGEIEYDDDITIDQLKITFSKSGTYAIRYFLKGAVVRVETANWRWDPSNSDKLQYAWYNDAFSNDSSVTIIKLTTSELVVKETWKEDDGEEGYSIITLKR